MIAREVIVMAVAIMATREAKADEVNLPVEEVSHPTGTTIERTFQSGHIVNISTLPVAAQLHNWSIMVRRGGEKATSPTRYGGSGAGATRGPQPDHHGGPTSSTRVLAPRALPGVASGIR